MIGKTEQCQCGYEFRYTLVLMQTLADKGMQTFVAELAVELQVNHP